MPSFESRLKKADETRNYLLEEMNHNNLVSEEYKKTCTFLNYIEHWLILVLRVTGCVSISAFASLVCVLLGIASSAVGIKICVVTAGIEKYKLIMKKNKKKHGKIVFLGKHKLNTTEVLISKALINSYISHEEFVLVNNLLREFNEMKEEIKNMVDPSRKTC